MLLFAKVPRDVLSGGERFFFASLISWSPSTENSHWILVVYGRRYRWADTSPSSIIVHLWIYTDHVVPVYRTGHKTARTARDVVADV
jgi:hypothetical protein